jgi:hypothetical protein
MRAGRPARADATASLLLLVLPLAVHARGLWPGRTLSPADILLATYPWRALAPGVEPANPTLVDVAYLFHPWTLWAAGEIQQGRFPLWNPHAFAGAPFFANPHSALLFPLTWLAWVLPAPLALTLMTAGKLALAGLAMYALLRGLGASPAPALVGATSFQWNGSLAAWVGWTNSTPALLLPLAFLCVERLRTAPSLRPAAGLALVVALAGFAGYPQGLLLCLAALGAWTACRAGGAPAGALRVLGGSALGLALGLALAAVQLLPFAEYARESAVYAYRRQWMPYLANPPEAAIALLMPLYFGHPGQGTYWGPWNFNEISAAVGLMPWLAIPAALALGRTGPLGFLAALAGLSGAILYRLPPVDAVAERLPVASFVLGFRLAPLMAFALCAGLGLALERLARAPAAARAPALAVKGAFAALVAAAGAMLVRDAAVLRLAGTWPPGWAQFLVFLALATISALLLLRLPGRPGPGRWLAAGALQVLPLLPLAWMGAPAISARWLYPTAPAIEHLKRAAASDPGRVLLNANVPMLHGLDDASGYDGMTPWRFERLVRPEGAFTLMGTGAIGVVDVFRSPVLDLLGVRRVVLPADRALTGEGFVLEYEGPDARVYRNDRAWPRAFVARRAHCVADDEAPRRLLAGLTAGEVLLAGCPPGQLDARGGGEARPVVAGAGPGPRPRFQAEGPGWLVLSDLWFPGWEARVSGQARPVLRANYAFRAVELPAGPHEVELSYRPLSVRLGLGLSAAALVGIVGVALAGPRRAAAVSILACALGVAAPAAALEPLPAAPWRLAMDRAAGAPALRLDPAGPAAPDLPEIGDLHIGVLRGWENPRFLTPAGAWSERAVPYLAGARLRAPGPLVVPWPPGHGPGRASVLAIVTRPGASPLGRSAWVARPALAMLRLPAPSPPGRGPATWGSVALGLASIVLVWLYPARPGPGAGHVPEI